MVWFIKYVGKLQKIVDVPVHMQSSNAEDECVGNNMNIISIKISFSKNYLMVIKGNNGNEITMWQQISKSGCDFLILQ